MLTLIASIGYGSTSAYLSAFVDQPNIVTVGHNDTTIKEDFPNTDPSPIPSNPSYKKIVQIANHNVTTGSSLVDCYVRVSLSYSNSDIGNAVTLLGLNTSDWTYDADDGFYYYNHVLKAGETTTPLITGFQIDSNKVLSDYKSMIDDFDINVYEESVQSDGFSNAFTAFDHYIG